MDSTTTDNASQKHYDRWPFVASGLFHLAVILLLVLFGHHVKSKPPEPEVMRVELLPIPEEAVLDLKDELMVEEEPPEPEEQPTEEPEPEPEVEEEAPEPPKPEPAPASQSIPTPPTPEPAPIPEPEPEVEPEPEATAEPEVSAPTTTPRPRARPKVNLPDPQADKQEVEPTTDFASVLKNLADVDPAPRSPDTPRQSPMLTQPPPVGAAMTRAELSALRRQLAGCWNVLPGARDAQDIVVRLRLSMNPDRTVRQAVVVDQARLSDPFYKAAADSALRAVRDPRCSPLALPEFKYDQWKELTIRFDPKDMF